MTGNEEYGNERLTATEDYREWREWRPLFKRYRARRFRRGFSLFGVLLGLGLAAVVIVGAVGTYNAAREAVNRSEAQVLLNRIRANIEDRLRRRAELREQRRSGRRARSTGAAFPIAPGPSGPATRPRSAIPSAGW